MLPSELKSIYLKIQNYCALAERCEKDVRVKLKEWGVNDPDIATCIELLIADKFVDNLRYARFFVSDKFRLQSWGRMKIINHLKAKSIAGQYIASALKIEINEDDYLNTIHQLARKKLTLLKHVNPPLLRKQKLLLFLVQKGFELDLSNKEVHALVK